MMMRRALLLFVLPIAFAGCGGCGGAGDSPGPTKEIATETMTKDGDVWKVHFTTKIDAPVDRVWEAFSQPERGKEFAPENLLKSELVKSDGNTKVVDIVGRLDILPPGFKVQNIRSEFVYFPADKKFTQKSVDFKLADLDATYTFKPTEDGKGTLVTFDQTSKTKSAMLVDSLQKGALRETYAIQIRAVNRALGLEPPAPPQG